MFKRFFKAPKKSFFLFGPRGTGKSTLIRQLYPDAPYIDLLDPEIYRRYLVSPESLRGFVQAYSNHPTFIIDEVQKVPDLLSVVHQLIEEKKGWQFVLTGSSSRKLKRSGVDLLAGRAALKTLHPFMSSEIKGLFLLEKALHIGLLPLVVDSENPAEDLRAYIALYMKEEVLQEGIIRHAEHFGRFLEAISFSQASVLNYSTIARDCGISSKTVETYIGILEDLLLSFRLPVFSKKAKRHLIAHPKFYFFDAGVYESIRPKGPLDQPEEISGHTLETLVAQHLRAWLDYSQKSGQLFFWRTKSKLEVDFIVYGEIGFLAIEVKNSAKIRRNELRGLKEFKKDYPEATCLFLYRGIEKRMIDGILCAPVEEWLANLEP